MSNKRQVASSLPVAKAKPFGKNVTAFMSDSWPGNVCLHIPSLMSHSFADASQAPKTNWGTISGLVKGFLLQTWGVVEFEFAFQHQQTSQTSTVCWLASFDIHKEFVPEGQTMLHVTAVSTSEILATKDFPVTPQLPYSSELNHCDFFLF